MPSLTLLDVGHGMATVLRAGDQTYVIDAGPGATLLDFLDAIGVVDIDMIVLSHADADHLAGAGQLLADTSLHIHGLVVNPDDRHTETWRDLRHTVGDARARGTHVGTSLTTESSPLADGVVRIEVLSPTPEIALGGVGGIDLHGRVMTANGMSAIIRVVVDDEPLVLLTGDADVVGVANLLESYPEPRARVLVFPHHGGNPAGDEFEFARTLCDAVQPDLVVFSIGRGRYATPRPDIVAGVRASRPDARVICTQLSEWCAAVTPANDPVHLVNAVAAGRDDRHCCAGTVILNLQDGELEVAPDAPSHRAFIDANAPTALCLGRGAVIAPGL